MYLFQPDRVLGVVSVDSDSFGKLNVRGMGPERFDEPTRGLYETHKALAMGSTVI
jgi:hypothetical protein